MVTSLSAFGILGMWTTIVLAHLGMQRAVHGGRISDQPFRIPVAPHTNYLVLAFLALVFVMT